MEDYKIGGYTFKQTCSGCPEQYDVYDKDYEQVGYIRLRWGDASCCCPDYTGEEVCSMEVGDGELAGAFENEEQRTEFLEMCAEAIDRWKEERSDIQIDDNEEDW